MKTEIRIWIIVFLSNVTFLSAQETEPYHFYQQSLEFKDGVYTNVDMVKKNTPIPSTWIETEMDVTDRDFYESISKTDEIVFHDEFGVRASVLTNGIWGYCSDGELHINVGGAFHKLDFVGRISHFIASKTTHYVNPYVGGYYTMDFWSSLPITVTVKHKEYLVDILENVVWEFDVEGLEFVLEKDPEIWNEFNALKKREKYYSRYIFLNRYNKKYPLDIPLNPGQEN